MGREEPERIPIRDVTDPEDAGDDGVPAAANPDQRGRRRSPSAVAFPAGVLVGLVCLVVGLLLGDRLAGTRHTATPSAHSTAPSATIARAPPDPPLELTSSRCSVQRGRTLQLGAEVTNVTTTPVIITDVRPMPVLAGLRATRTAAGTCGQLGDDVVDSVIVGANDAAWFTASFDVLVSCPSFVPVAFSVSYRQDGRSGTVQLLAFNDLGNVPYTGCPSS